MRKRLSIKSHEVLLFTLILIVSTSVFNSLCLGTRDDSRWWQREELKPSTNQIINPDYLSKKRGLDFIQA